METNPPREETFQVIRLLSSVAFTAIVILVSGCTAWKSPVIPPTGNGFAAYGAPVDIDYNRTSIGSSKGEATAFSVMGLISVGDASIMKAARDGDIKQIDHVEHEFLNVLVIFIQYKTLVYGRTASQLEAEEYVAQDDEPEVPKVDLWYAVIDNEQQGPFDAGTLESMLEEGTIGEDTLVWKEGMEDWERVSTLMYAKIDETQD